ncbi:hypothetical protein X798_04473 [Onchocerca flexuosa]|uniref:Uncharacterized protein n=1 Tax=Onchocerca flexuosa TaxID=387005 RepID=A0A238BT56_9BILA|nr:hypothetical protein X798_04473 [Onchocerca flexuosa]
MKYGCELKQMENNQLISLSNRLHVESFACRIMRKADRTAIQIFAKMLFCNNCARFVMNDAKLKN